MSKEKIDLTKRVYSIVGTTLFFESLESVIRFLHKVWKVSVPVSSEVKDLCEKWVIDKKDFEIKEKDHKSSCRILNPGGVFNDYGLIEYKYNDHSARIGEFLLVSTDEQIEACINLPVVKESSFYQELPD